MDKDSTLTILYFTSEVDIKKPLLFTFIKYKKENGHVAIANRMFEMCLLNMFMVKEAINSDVYVQGGSDKIGFIKDNRLDMELVLKKGICSSLILIKNKNVGVHEIKAGNKAIVEAAV